MGNLLELLRYDARCNLGFHTPQRTVPRREQVVDPEEAFIFDGAGVACTRDDDSVGVQSMARSIGDKGDDK